jgi:hypothetical protein
MLTLFSLWQLKFPWWSASGTRSCDMWFGIRVPAFQNTARWGERLMRNDDTRLQCYMGPQSWLFSLYVNIFLSFAFIFYNPITGLNRPRGLHEVKAPRFQDNRHMKVVRLSAISNIHLYPQEIFLFLFLFTRWCSGWGNVLQALQVQFPMVSLEFFIDIILPATLWPWGWLNL